MTLRLSDFEQQIDPTILRRGYEYFIIGSVTDVDDLGDGEYEATVEGSDIYNVSLHIEGDEVTEYDCDCPYDWGPVCKHVVAVLFHLRKELQETPRKQTRSKPKKESEAAQFERLLKQLTAEELKAFINDACAQDKSLRRLFIAKHISRLYPESKELYDRQVEKLIETYADRYGFIGYHESSQLGDIIYEMVEDAKRCVKAGKMQKALYMSEAIIEGLSYAINNADDSDGEISGCLEEALDVLEELAQTDLDESPRVEMFRWLLHHFEANTMAGWDLHTDLMRIAISIVRTEDEKKRIQTNLEQIKPNGKDRDYAYQTVQKLKLQLIHQTEDEAAAIHFMEANVDNPDIRKYLIVDYMPDHIGRSHYQMACKYIRRMAKLGYKPMALELIEQLRTQYRNRRALLEELTGIF